MAEKFRHGTNANAHVDAIGSSPGAVAETPDRSSPANPKILRVVVVARCGLWAGDRASTSLAERRRSARADACDRAPVQA